MSNQYSDKHYSDNREFQPFVIRNITFRKIRLIDENETYHASFQTEDAKKRANSVGLDLVCFSNGDRRSNEMPLCKIINYGKWKYANDKKQKQQHKNNQKHTTKEIQFSLGIDDHDIEHKIKQTKKFLEGHMDVKLVMRLFGRDRNYFNLAEDKMAEIINLCSDCGKVHDTKKTNSMIAVRLIPV